MAIAGAGAGINELTALAATAELAPTRKRGKYVAVLIFTIVPFCPSVLWGQLIASHAGWRYCGVLCGVWAAVGLVLTAVFYFPPPRVNSQGLSRKEILAQIDWVGGFLSIVGTIIFIAAILWGGYQVSFRAYRILESSLTVFVVQVVLRTRSGSTDPWFPYARWLCRVGVKVRQVPHVPRPHKASSAHFDTDPYHYCDLRSELLLHHYVLAYPGFQCLWP